MKHLLKQKIARGFTLIETLIAVLILTTAVAGPLTIASKGLTATLVAKDQISAFYLAQDAVEYVHFLRDSACLAAGPQPSGGCPVGTWLSGLVNCTSADGSKSCYFDSLEHNPQLPATCVTGCPVMQYDGSSHSFNYNPDTANAPFTPQRYVRTVTMQNDPTGVATPIDEAILTVTMTWSDMGGITHTAVVRENLFRWQ